MRSNLPKVLHKIGGLPLIAHVIRSLEAAGSDELAIIIGHGGAEVRREVEKSGIQNIQFFEQKERLGTAHAVLSAEEALTAARNSGDVCDILIAYGDTPLMRPKLAQDARQKLAAGADVVVSGFYAANPHGYGRLIENAGRIEKIVEEKDADAAQKQIKLCNGGFMAVSSAHILPLLQAVKNDNAKREYYLTDIVEIAAKQGLRVEVLSAEQEDALGVNSRAELAAAEAIWQNRKRQDIMAAGVTLQVPETVFFSYDTEIGMDTVIEPQVFFGEKVKIAPRCAIRAFSHIEGAEIGEGSAIGPYARLRPGSRLAENVKIGNFCELKQTYVGEGAKINHLTYMGDAEVGAGSNIGAGTITCNYDGFNKEKVSIGARAFIGSNTSLVAPLTIGNGAYIASGSVITADVADDALAFGRARQAEKPEGGKRLRALFSMRKAEKDKKIRKEKQKATE